MSALKPRKGIILAEGFGHASGYIATLERRQGLKVACPEEMAFRQRWIDAEQLQALAEPMRKNGYGQYLLRLLRDPVLQG